MLHIGDALSFVYTLHTVCPVLYTSHLFCDIRLVMLYLLVILCVVYIATVCPFIYTLYLTYLVSVINTYYMFFLVYTLYSVICNLHAFPVIFT